MTLASPGGSDGGFEREQLLVPELTRADVDRGLVESALGESVADHVLGRWRSRRHADRNPGSPRCRRSRAPRRGTGLRRTSPRYAPSAGRARYQGPGEGVPGAGHQHPTTDRRGHRGDESGSKLAAAPMDCWKHGASEAIARGGIPRGRSPGSRALSLRQIALDRVGGLATSTGRRLVEPASRVIWPMPSPARAASRASSNPDRGRPRRPRASRAGRPSRRGSSA